MKFFGLVRRVLAASVSLSVLVGLPCAAMAQEEWMQPSDDSRGAALDPSVALDRRFDMRDDPAMYVSEVKFQNPWGTCWAFGATSAAESSIFADLGKRVDLSERHLAWFAYTPIAAVDDPSQVGEGLYPVSPSTNPNGGFAAGNSVDVLRAYSSGAGPVPESTWPYHGKDGLTELELVKTDPERWKQGERERIFNGMTVKEISEFLEEEECASVDEFLEKAYRTRLSSLEEDPRSNAYSALDDWSIPERDAAGRSVRNQSAGFLVKDVNLMSSSPLSDPQTDDSFLNEETMAAVKQELRRGHGVVVSYAAANPAGSEGQPSYIRDGTYAQYTWKRMGGNHAVCIVGWDDDYAVSNFNRGTVTEQTDKGPVTYDMAPPGPGAWIVKNSWGRTGGTEVKRGGPLGDVFTQILGDSAWGVNGTGYFYLSYYDQSVSEFTSYGFIEDLHPGKTVCHQYDYLGSRPQYRIVRPTELSAANVFDVRQDETLTSVGAETLADMYNTEVIYAIYRLREGATSPVDGELCDTISCLYAYPGYHREQLDPPIPLSKGDRFSVVVTQSHEDARKVTQYAICADSEYTEAFAREERAKHYGKAVVNRGESWAFVDGRWQDWLDVLAASPNRNPSETVIDNVGIKAFAQAAEEGVYRWTSDGGHIWWTSMSQGLDFTLERTEHPEDTATHVTGVFVDGKELSEGEYVISRANDGATVTLTADLLEGLSTGSHKLAVALDDAQPLQATFTVEKGPSGPEPAPEHGGDRKDRDDRQGGGYPYRDQDRYRRDGSYFYDNYDDAYRYGTFAGWMSDNPSGSTVGVMRVAGADRYQTMTAVVSGAFPSSEVCVVASGATYADALCAAGLAGTRRAPVVLTTPGALSPEAAAEIGRLGARRVILMGGNKALSPAVADAVAALGVDVSRVAGADRAATSVAAMRRAREAGSSSDTVFVASGSSFADALAAGPWAWSIGAPVLLCGADGLLSPEALSAISADGHIRRVMVLGGPAAVGDVTSQLPSGMACERLGGADRYQTARLVAERAVREGLSFSVAYVASGSSFADALAAGPVAGARGGVLLLADPAGSTLAAALAAHKGAMGPIAFVGGEAAVGQAVVDAARWALR